MTFTTGGLRLEQPFRIRRIGHFGYHSPDITATIEFLTRKLGLNISDIDDFSSRLKQPLPKVDATGWFLRCGPDHHTLVVGSQNLIDTREPARKGAVVNQLSWQVGSLQEVVDGVSFLDRKAKLRRIGRDTPGSNWHAYAYDPDGYVNEIFYGMEQIGWDGRSKPETMYDRGFTTLPELPQIPEYIEVDNALLRKGADGGYRWNEPREAKYQVEGILMPQPFKLTHLGRVALYVADLQASLDFYCGVLGLKLSERFSVLGHECAFLRADAEHHTLALYPKALREQLGFAAGCGFAVATYQQLVEARQFLEKQGVRILDLPAELSPGVHYGFWVQGPDTVAIQIFYGMDRVGLDGVAPKPATLPVPCSQWPESIVHGGTAWFEPPFLGPWL